MRLRQALGVMPGDVVALVGGGGKTSTALALAHELAPLTRVIFTTTTRIYPVPGLPVLLTSAGPGWREKLLVGERGAGEILGPVVLACEELPGGKLKGLDSEVVNEVASFVGAGRLGAGSVEAVSAIGPGMAPVLLVEADGSAGRPFKAPAGHEPVIPGCSTLVLALAGADAIGRPLDRENVHRPEAVARILGLPEAYGQRSQPVHRLSAQDIATVLLHPDGTARGRPGDARLVPVLTRIDRAGVAAQAEEAASALIEMGARRVALIALDSTVSSARPRGPVAAVILAAGLSRRFGSPKLLHPIGGLPMLERTVRAACRAGFARVTVVIPTGPGETGVVIDKYRRLLEPYPVELAFNPAPEAGQSGSVRAGVDALNASVPGPERPEAAMFIPGDQPFLTPAILDALIEAWVNDRPAVLAPAAGGRRLSPVIFSKELFPELLKLTGDQGGRMVLESRPELLRTLEFADPAPFRDIDFPEEVPHGRRNEDQ